MAKKAKRMTSLESILMIVVIALMIIIGVVLFRNVQEARRAGIFAEHASVSELLLRHRQMNKTTVRDAEHIDSWMTFQYVNFIFNLPTDYLKTTLLIDDRQYPNIPIGRYIKKQKIDREEFMESLKKAVQEYIKSHNDK